MASFVSKDLFPTRLSLMVFVAYIFFGICHSLLITASKSPDHGYEYNTVTVVLLISLVKLIASSALFINDHVNKDATLASTLGPPSLKPKTSTRNAILLIAEGCQLLGNEIAKNKKLWLYFFIPAALYTTYDNLIFVSLAVFTPTTYYLLTQSRIVLTAVVFERLFNQKLSRIQWFSLFCLTQGCVLKELYNYLYNDAQHKNQHHFYEYISSMSSIGVQIICSCFASVYTEYLFKDKDSRAHPMVENVIMYSNNIVCGVFVLTIRGELLTAFSHASLASVMKIGVVAIILNQSMLGLITATFLRKLNSILKSFAVALELVLTPFMCWILFGQRVDMCTVAALCVVFGASCVYAVNPVRSAKTNADLSVEKEVNTQI